MTDENAPKSHDQESKDSGLPDPELHRLVTSMTP